MGRKLVEYIYLEYRWSVALLEMNISISRLLKYRNLI